MCVCVCVIEYMRVLFMCACEYKCAWVRACVRVCVFHNTQCTAQSNDTSQLLCRSLPACFPLREHGHLVDAWAVECVVCVVVVGKRLGLQCLCAVSTFWLERRELWEEVDLTQIPWLKTTNPVPPPHSQWGPVERERAVYRLTVYQYYSLKVAR